MNSLVSVVLPTFNQADYLLAAIDSILSQTYKNFELIIVNDGSTDGTAKLLETYAKIPSVKVINQDNQRLPRALNTGFASANGQYLTWTSSDNLLHPEMLQILVTELGADSEIGLVYADRFLIDEKGVNLGEFCLSDYDPYLLLHVNFVHCCFLYRRECQDKIGFYDPSFIYAEDWEYWIRMSQYYKMKHIPKPLYYYRVHKKSMTSEMVDGSADYIRYSKFSDAIRKRMPWKWSLGKIRWWWLKLSNSEHPAVTEYRKWMKVIHAI
jgi:glycosyltransferase involved in cell wall biosynthesis